MPTIDADAIRALHDQGLAGREIARRLGCSEKSVRRVLNAIPTDDAPAVPLEAAPAPADDATVPTAERVRNREVAAPDFAAERRVLDREQAELERHRPGLSLAAYSDAAAAKALVDIEGALRDIERRRERLALAEAEAERQAEAAARQADADRHAAARQRIADARAQLPEAYAAIDGCVAALCAATRAALMLAHDANVAMAALPRGEWLPGGDTMPVLNALGRRVLRPLATDGGLEGLLPQWGTGRWLVPATGGAPTSARPPQPSRPAPGEPIYGPQRADIGPTPRPVLDERQAIAEATARHMTAAGLPATVAAVNTGGSRSTPVALPLAPSVPFSAPAAPPGVPLYAPATSSPPPGPYAAFAANGPNRRDDQLVHIPCPGGSFTCGGDPVADAVTARARAWAAHYAGRR